jgi:hypothetical protein
MFRIIKRSPWIALGAAGAWFLDPVQGAQRRAAVTAKAREWKLEMASSRPAQAPFGTSPTTVPSDTVDPTLAQRSA